MGQSAFAHTQQVCESSRWRAVGVGVGTAGGGGGGRGCRTSGREGEGVREGGETRACFKSDSSVQRRPLAFIN